MARPTRRVTGVLLLAAGTAALAADADIRSGRVVAVQGTCSHQARTEEKWQPLKPGVPLGPGDRIRCAPQAFVTALLPGGSSEVRLAVDPRHGYVVPATPQSAPEPSEGVGGRYGATSADPALKDRVAAKREAAKAADKSEAKK